MPGPRSMTRNSTEPAWADAVTRTGIPVRGVPKCVLHQVRDHPLQQAGVGVDLRQVVGHVHVDGTRRWR